MGKTGSAGSEPGSHLCFHRWPVRQLHQIRIDIRFPAIASAQTEAMHHDSSVSSTANRHGLLLARSMREAGRSSGLYAAARAGDVQLVRTGAYRIPDAPDDTRSRSAQDAARYRLLTLAAAAKLTAPVFTGYSAIALAGLPILGPWPAVVYLLSGGDHGRRRPGVVHVAHRLPVALTLTDGILVTNLEYSLIQLCKQASLAAALVAMDAALRGPRVGAGVPMTDIDCVRAEHERLLPYHGSRRAEAVLTRATALSDGPLETGSRLVIEEAGFPDPELQHELALPDGRRWLDFYWPDYDIAAEADGDGKYGSTVADAASTVIAEKNREDAIRERVRGFTRWGWRDMWTKRAVRAKLIRAGLPLVRKPSHLF